MLFVLRNRFKFVTFFTKMAVISINIFVRIQDAIMLEGGTQTSEKPCDCEGCLKISFNNVCYFAKKNSINSRLIYRSIPIINPYYVHLYVIISSPYCIIQSLYHCIIVSLYHCIIVSLYHCIILSLYHTIIVSYYRCIITMPVTAAELRVQNFGWLQQYTM